MGIEQEDYKHEEEESLAWIKYQQEVEDKASCVQYHEDMGVDLPSWSK